LYYSEDADTGSKRVQMKFSLEQMYPNIARWVYEHEGWIEIGDRTESPLTSFVRARNFLMGAITAFDLTVRMYCSCCITTALLYNLDDATLQEYK
jgi:hypothetical protein